MGIQGSLRFWIAGTGFQSLSVALGFWNSVVSGIPDLELYSRFQSLGIRDSTSKNFPDSRIRILFNEGLHCGPQIRQKQQKQLTEINITLDYESELVTNNGGIYGLFQEFSLRERRKLKKSAPEKNIEVCMEKGQEISLFFSLSFSIVHCCFPSRSTFASCKEIRILEYKKFLLAEALESGTQLKESGFPLTNGI